MCTCVHVFDLMKAGFVCLRVQIRDVTRVAEDFISTVGSFESVQFTRDGGFARVLQTDGAAVVYDLKVGEETVNTSIEFAGSALFLNSSEVVDVKRARKLVQKGNNVEVQVYWGVEASKFHCAALRGDDVQVEKCIQEGYFVDMCFKVRISSFKNLKNRPLCKIHFSIHEGWTNPTDNGFNSSFFGLDWK